MNVGKVVRPSQLIRSVRRTWVRRMGAITCWLVFAGSIGAAAGQPLPITAELRPAALSAETPLELILRSQSKERLELQVYSRLRARRLGAQGYQPDVYWAPLDLAGGRFYPEQTVPWLKLDPGGSLTVSFSLTRLRWELELPGRIDHQWPHEALATLVLPGEYDLWYEVGGLAHPNVRPVASRPVRLTVH